MTLYKVFKNIAIVIFILATQTVKAETKDQRIKVELRTICHEFLLQLGDSTSRILPIDKIDGRYVVTFQNDFAFQPDLLLFSVFKIYEEKRIKEHFIVEVEKCKTGELVHSFQASRLDNLAMKPCRMRGLPKDCYVFYFTEVINFFPEEEDVVYSNAEESNPIQESGTPPYLFSLIVLLVGVSTYYVIRKRSIQAKPEQVSDLINIGQYQFDKKGMLLMLEGNSVELSMKETDLLYLLYTNENKTLEREYILNQVWKDEGNYVGRTLDVFISKLRKKLENDPNIKIMNVRGVGYKFVINTI